MTNDQDNGVLGIYALAGEDGFTEGRHLRPTHLTIGATRRARRAPMSALARLASVEPSAAPG
ncbi:hypothetical protein [Dongia mobilis]|uniref:hypothetical protein n=1 Tax=Dongia sp. TaxID=1977262 RepID=UPI0026F28F1F